MKVGGWNVMRIKARPLVGTRRLVIFSLNGNISFAFRKEPAGWIELSGDVPGHFATLKLALVTWRLKS